MNAELCKAVREYVDKLLVGHDQSHDALGDVTPEEILVAARAAGLRASRSEVVSLAAKEGVNVVNRDPPLEEGAQDVRSKSAPAQRVQPGAVPTAAPATQVKHRKDYHWIQWKTSPTPPPITPRPPSARPSSSVPKRGWQTPDGFRTPSVRPEQVLVQYPGGVRTPTPVGRVGAPTPNEMKPDHRDPLSAAQTAPRELALQKLKENQAEENQTLFVPALKAWVSNANDYERDVAFSLLTSVSGGGNTFRDCFRTGGHRRPGSSMRMGQNRPQTAGVRTKPMHLSAPHIEQQYINLMGRSLQREAPTSIYETPLYGSSLRPMAKHAENVRHVNKDYTHEASMFMNARLPYKSNFTVHPEWVSENPALKRNLPLMKTTKGPKGFRYSSK